MLQEGLGKCISQQQGLLEEEGGGKVDDKLKEKPEVASQSLSPFSIRIVLYQNVQ
jgi:hypothetical protein